MNERAPLSGRSEKRSGGRLSESNPSAGRAATWREVDRVLEVRSRLVVALDSIEAGDVHMAELCLFQLLDDLDAAEFLTAKAA